MTQEKLEKYFELHEELSKLNELTSEALRTVRDRFDTCTHVLERDGKKVKVSEKTLWNEVWHYGIDSEAGKILNKKYPDVFEYKAKADKKADEISMYELAQLGFKFSKMNGANMIKLVNALIELNRKKYENNH